MALTLSEIQTLVRHEVRDNSLDLTSGTGLSVANMLYRRYSSFIAWPELTRTSTLTTTAGSSVYTWPSDNSYSDVRIIEIQNPDKDLDFTPVVPARSEIVYTKYSGYPKGFPVVYRRDNDGISNILNLAPAPNVTGLTIRIKGVVEPNNLSSGSSETVFLNKSSDDGLAYLISADYASKRAQPQRAQALLAVVTEVLSRRAGKEVLPEEVKKLLVS